MRLGLWMIAAMLAASTAYADEKNEETHAHDKVTMAELPAPVKTTVDRESKGKTIEWMAKEDRNGKTVYEVELVADGKGQVLDISQAGKVLDRHAKHDESKEAEHEDKR